MAERGDLIGCTVLFEMAENGKVPILFTLNGKQITQASISIEFDQKNLLLFPFVSMGHEGVVVSAKVSTLCISVNNSLFNVLYDFMTIRLPQQPIIFLEFYCHLTK